MDKTNYTKGEWMLLNDTFTKTIYEKLTDGCRGRVICQIPYNTTDNTESNAQLISACPDMYEALAELRKGKVTMSPYYVEKIEQALAKAEGK